MLVKLRIMPRKVADYRRTINACRFDKDKSLVAESELKW